jgi:hypothetical protein
MLNQMTTVTENLEVTQPVKNFVLEEIICSWHEGTPMSPNLSRVTTV